MENRQHSVAKSIAELHSAVADNVHRMQRQLNSMEAKVDGLTSKIVTEVGGMLNNHNPISCQGPHNTVNTITGAVEAAGIRN
ncbi:hypothetical protein GQ600_24853 [Phytophthora cactorum]|nr:hypothetical protein GQ600_24853 [Phytophthora cactorum]